MALFGTDIQAPQRPGIASRDFTAPPVPEPKAATMSPFGAMMKGLGEGIMADRKQTNEEDKTEIRNMLAEAQQRKADAEVKLDNAKTELTSANAEIASLKAKLGIEGSAYATQMGKQRALNELPTPSKGRSGGGSSSSSGNPFEAFTGGK